MKKILTVPPLIFGAMLALGAAASAVENPAMTQTARDEKLAEFFDVYATAWSIPARMQKHPRHDIFIAGPMNEASYDPMPNKEAGGAPDFLMRIAVANASFVVEGTPVSERCLPVASNSYLFTEYTVRVDKVHLNKTHQITPGSTIIIARDGGITQTNGVTVRAGAPSFEPLSPGTEYFFALRPIPKTDAYFSNSKSIFELSKGNVHPVSGVDRSPQHARSEAAFRSELAQVLQGIQ